MRSRTARRLRALWALPLLAAVLGACAGTSGPAVRATQQAAESTDEWPQAYKDAIADALNPEPGEVVDDLTPIAPDNPDLVWRDIAGTPHVLMVSLVGNTSYYENYVGKPYDTGAHYIWLTAVPELRDGCRQPDFGGGDLALRLRQLLGLTPTAKVVAFVEFWVDPATLFRPATNHDITAASAGLHLPDQVEPWYRRWFNDLRARQYFQSEDPKHDAYPWTQLGYTYDWGAPGAERGLSEFVVKTHSQVVVEAIYPLAAYCGQGGG